MGGDSISLLRNADCSPQTQSPVFDKQTRHRATSSASFSFSFSTHLLPLTNSLETVRHSVPTLNTTSAIALVVSSQIGSGIFSSPGILSQNCGSPGASLIVWTLAGILAWTGASSFAELGAAIPVNGGAQAYLNYSFGGWASYLFIWTNLVALKPGSAAIISIVGSEYLCRILYHSQFQGESERHDNSEQKLHSRRIEKSDEDVTDSDPQFDGNSPYSNDPNELVISHSFTNGSSDPIEYDWTRIRSSYFRPDRSLYSLLSSLSLALELLIVVFLLRLDWLVSLLRKVMFSNINEKTLTPINALGLHAFLTIIMIGFGDFKSLVGFYGTCAWTFYLLTVGSLLLLRIREPDLERPYQTWVINPITFSTVASFLLLMPVFSAPLQSLAAFGFIIAGLPFIILQQIKNSVNSGFPS
ncbi:hypothetical protein KEM48_010073 [Puccinia striiformis f. sp. tritici PST-130]|nr:hypothetical protein KEM48_010073 [Puccinia striiformis f. sp. tritici PST-130]